jgi:signal transduction histidine kinase
MRITDDSGRICYVSANARNLSSPPRLTWNQSEQESKPVARDELDSAGEHIEVVAIGYRIAGGNAYIVEVGAPEASVLKTLYGLAWTLAFGFPLFICLTAMGGYYLLGRALRPFDEIVRSAEQITEQNLSSRLPVPTTGDEVERLSLTLNRMIQRLEEAFQQATRFSGDASHELRTPLTIMRGEIEALISRGGLNADQSDQLGSVLEEIDHLTRIVEGLLLMSRLEAGESQSEMRVVNLGQLVALTAEQMVALAEEKALRVDQQLGKDTIVDGDEMRLKQVVVNLFDNAIKYTGNGGTISLRVWSDRKQAFFEMTDTGIGISAQAVPHVFERFYRSPQADVSRIEGTGLGLAMVGLIVEAHGGSVSVQSAEGRGSTFLVQLPLSKRKAV